MTPHIVTSSDSRYACRLLVMLESLRRHHLDADVTVLCLDGDMESILRARPMERVSTVTTEDLVLHEPRLADVRSKRGAWEFYATQKPILLSMLIERIPESELIAFVDSDIFFYTNADALFGEMAGASIGLCPNRFSESTAHLIQYGSYCAGFGIWRHDLAGKRCLRDWSEDCLEWCHARVDGNRFMNQGYLVEWPERYEQVRILTNHGANVAPWNLESHHITCGPDGVMIGDLPLLFFHFSGIARFSDGRWMAKKSPGMNNPCMLRAIYGPYLNALDEMEADLRRSHDINASGSVRLLKPELFPIDLRAGAETIPATHDPLRKE